MEGLNLGYSSADEEGMPHRRATPRNLCSDIVEIHWVDRSGYSLDATGVLEDISSTGACVMTEVAVSVEAASVLLMGEFRIPCEVRYCVSAEIGYMVGVSFRPGYSWSEEQFLPGHLLDLSGR